MTSQPTPPDQAVLAAQHQFWDALKAKDAALFERVLAHDYVSRSPGQPDQGRADLIRTLTAFPADVLSVGGDNLQVRAFGEVAVLTGVQVARLRLPDGREIADTIAITNVFRAAAGGWKMVLSHAVSLSSSS